MPIIRMLSSPAGVERFARDLAGVLRAGDVVALDGPLGAGKTTLVRALASVYRIDPGAVSSPTFVLVHRYEREGGAALIHIDAYRLDKGDLESLGLDAMAPDALGRTGPAGLRVPGAITIVEWASRLEDAVPSDALRIELEHVSENVRRARVTVPATWADRQGLVALEAPPATICPITGNRVEGDSPTWPFFDERARLADLGRWFSESYQISRPIEQRDVEEGS